MSQDSFGAEQDSKQQTRLRFVPCGTRGAVGEQTPPAPDITQILLALMLYPTSGSHV